MSKAFHIISDGSCDLSPEIVQETGITVVPFYVSFDDEHYLKEIQEIGIRDFYQQMVDNPKVFPKSSMPSVQDYIDAFMPWVEQKIPVVCICITAKFSGSVQSAANAARQILEEHPDAQIQVIDSTVDTVLQGQLVLEVVNMQRRGFTYEQTIKRIEEIKGTGRIFFTVGSLDYLIHGGRIGKVAAVAGSILGIRPIITLKEGEIFASGVGRSRKTTLNHVLELMIKYLKDVREDVSDYSFSVGYGYDYEEAVVFQERILEALQGRVKREEVPIRQIGATISVHTGPYPLGLGVIRKA